MRSTQSPSSDLPAILTVGASQARASVHTQEEDDEGIEMGNLYTRRKSRMSNREEQPAKQHQPSWFDTSADLPLRTYVAEQAVEGANVKRPDTAHLHPAGNIRSERYTTHHGRGSDGEERDLEAGVWLTRREKKEWAILILAGSLSVCALCGLIAGLAVT